MGEESTNYNMIGKRIKIAREKIHITQEELAIAIGCTSQHISVIERGIKLPRLDTFIKIINVLHTYPEIILQDVLLSSTDIIIDKEFSSIISSLPNNEKRRIVEVVRILVYSYNC